MGQITRGYRGFSIAASSHCRPQRVPAVPGAELLKREAAAPVVGDAQQRFVHLAPLDATQVDEEATVSQAEDLTLQYIYNGYNIYVCDTYIYMWGEYVYEDVYVDNKLLDTIT